MRGGGGGGGRISREMEIISCVTWNCSRGDLLDDYAQTCESRNLVVILAQVSLLYTCNKEEEKDGAT